LVEHLICNQWVPGSNPGGGTICAQILELVDQAFFRQFISLVNYRFLKISRSADDHDVALSHFDARDDRARGDSFSFSTDLMWWTVSAPGIAMCQSVAVESPHEGEPSLEQVSTIGLDIAKHVFQVHGVDAVGAVVVRRKLRREDVAAFFRKLPPCLIGIEACATGHHWARVLLALGHEVRLMPASYVKPYVKRQKNDATDAEAICEAVARPTMRFVPVKSEEQQSVLMLHRVRELLIRQRTMLVNALRGHLAEFGIVTRQGIVGVGMLIALVEDDGQNLIPPLARSALLSLIGQLREVHERVGEMDCQIHAWHRSNELSRRLETIPGIGPITASAIAATVTDASLFKSGRQLAAWIGLVPRQNSSGGKDRLGRISKQGDPYLRRLLVVGAHAVLRFSRKARVPPTQWAAELLAKKPYNVVAVALANKMARIVWALMTTGRRFEAAANL
jgi:transposase